MEYTPEEKQAKDAHEELRYWKSSAVFFATPRGLRSHSNSDEVSSKKVDGLQTLQRGTTALRNGVPGRATWLAQPCKHGWMYHFYASYHTFGGLSSSWRPLPPELWPLPSFPVQPSMHFYVLLQNHKLHDVWTHQHIEIDSQSHPTLTCPSLQLFHHSKDAQRDFSPLWQ